MTAVVQPWQILVTTMAGWITRQQDAVVEYLRERKTEFSSNNSVADDSG